jgi:choline kinase
VKAILLAAGRGTRISRMVEEIPKSTLPLGGTPLIRITVEMLLKRGIEVIICIGYRHIHIKQVLKGLPVKYYLNPFYDITNSIASLWIARNEIDDDMLILNADVYFSNEILDIILSDKKDVTMAIDKSRTATGDYFFSTTPNGCIRKYGKEIPLEERNCEYVGIAKINKSFTPHFKRRMDALIKTQHHDYWWENVLYSFTDFKEKNIYTVDVNGLFWSEIDYFDDYERILNYMDQKKGNLNL